MNSPLFESLSKHIDTIFDHTSDLNTTLRRCLLDSKILVKEGDNLLVFENIVIDLRKRHPHGLSTRPARRYSIVSQLEADFYRILGPAALIPRIATLISNREDEEAFELLKQFPENDPSDLGRLVGYLRFVLNSKFDLYGMTYFKDLTPTDFFLAACYGSADISPSNWNYNSVTDCFAQKGDSQELNLFKVKSLQPRIAELAFHQVYAKMYNGTKQNTLRDLNAEVVLSLALPWSLKNKPLFPTADWCEGTDGTSYDVKCNPFYRSKQGKHGLRGFLIHEKSENPEHVFPGFIFYESNDNSCSWIYVGDYIVSNSNASVNDRVLPFRFKLPANCRFEIPCDPTLGVSLLEDNPLLQMGWQLACGSFIGPEDGLFNTFIKMCIAKMCDEHLFLEYALWKSLSETTINALGIHSIHEINTFLNSAKTFLSSRVVPLYLPRIYDEPLLVRWINDVLDPIVKQWSQVSCPKCRADANLLTLSVTGMSSEGTIYGLLNCKLCHKCKDVTVITHCYKCSHFPLIIGKNDTCNQCGGLICDWSTNFHDTSKSLCGACKKGCERNQTIPEEAVFV